MKLLLLMSLFFIFSCANNRVHIEPKADTRFRPRMIALECGTFMMGHGYAAYSWVAPAHKVDLSSFYMGETEVTWAQFTAMQKAYPKIGFDSIYTIADGNLQKPAVVNFVDAARYCNALSIQEGRKPCYALFTLKCNFKADGYRLPTEAEWEYACRAGTTGQYFWIPDTAKDRTFYADTALLYAWFADTSKVRRYQPVRQLRPNGFGLYDMIGNVQEWCNDLWDPWYYQRSPVNNPKGSSYLFNWNIWLQLGGRMVRGADNHNNSSGLASYYRPSVSYDPEYDKAGIRLVLNRPVPDGK